MLIPILFIYGACCGSLLVALASRYATGTSYFFPRSHCDTCQTPLAYWQLVPVLSYLLARGKCRTCTAVIPPITLILEVGAGLIATTVATPFSLRIALWLGLWTFAALCDARCQTFPGWVSWLALGVDLLAQPPLIWLVGILGFGLIRVLWPRWSRPLVGDGDLQMILSYGRLWGLPATAQWLLVACGLALWRARRGERLAFLPYLVMSAVGWWLWR